MKGKVLYGIAIALIAGAAAFLLLEFPGPRSVETGRDRPAVPNGPPVAEAAKAAAVPANAQVTAAPETHADRVLRAFLVRSRTSKPIPGSMTVTGPGGFTRTTHADSDGCLRIDGLPRDVPLSVVVTSPGLLPYRIRGVVLPATGEFDFGVLALGGAVPVEVLVSDDEGRPVPGAVVSIDDCRWEEGLPGLPQPVATATTGEDGRAALVAVPPGRWRLLTRARGRGRNFQSLELVEGAIRAPIRIVLQPALALEGRILDQEAKPASGIEVALLEPQWGPRLASATADSEGGFRFDELPEGEFRIAVRMGARVLEVLGKAPVPSTGPLEFRIPPRHCILGRVLDDISGHPIEKARISCWVSGQERGWIGTPGILESGADGAFRVAGLPPLGTTDADPHLFLGVERDGYLPAWNNWQDRSELTPYLVPFGTHPAQARRHEVRLRRPGAALRGVVRTRDGNPVPGAWVTIAHRTPDGSHQTWAEASSDREGRYRMPPVPPGAGVLLSGAYKLHLEGMGGNPYEEPFPANRTVVLPGAGEVVKDLVLVPDSAVEGRMVLADGSPAMGFIPVLMEDGREVARGAPSGEDGTFAIEELESCTRVSVAAEGPKGRACRSEPFEIQESQRVTGILVRVVLPGSVSGRILGPDGKPVSAAFLRLVPEESGLAGPGEWRNPIPWTTGADAAPDGSFLAEDLEAGPWIPFALAPGFLGTKGDRLEIAEGERKTGLVLTLRAGRSIAGRVLDPAGAPAVGATVLAFERPKLDPERFSGNVILQPLGPSNAAQSARSAADGTFGIGGLDVGEHLFVAVKEGYVAGGAETGEERSDVVLRLRPAFAIAGRVVDASGSPVAGATVSADVVYGPEGATASGDSDPGTSASEVLRLWGMPGSGESGQALSEADGSFRVTGLAAGTFRLAASKQGHIQGGGNAEAGTSGVLLPLRAAFTIEGRVLESRTGLPVAGARVTASGVRDPGGLQFSSRSSETAWTGPDGTFRIEGLAEGSYDLRVSPVRRAENWGFLSKSVREIRAGVSDLAIEIDRGLSIAGRAVDAGGGTLQREGICVRLSLPGAYIHDWSGEQAWLDEDGRFSFSGLPAGRYAVTVSPETGVDERPVYSRRRIEAEAGTTDLVVPLARGKTISGKVVFPAGNEPRAAPWILIRPSRWHVGVDEFDGALVEEDGSFVTGPLEEGIPCDLEARATENRVAVARGVSPGATGVVLRVQAELTLSGTVVGPDGTAAAGARVAAYAGSKGGESVEADCDEGGAFLLEGLAPGVYRIYGSSQEANLAPVEPEAHVEAGASEAVVRTVAGNEFRARLVHPDGSAVPEGEYSVLVDVTAYGLTWSSTEPVGEGGRIALRGLAKCSLRLRPVRESDSIVSDEPTPFTTFGPFEVPCPEQTLVVGR